ncbi:MAG: Fur family transcriptional regulator [Negativicutes bacterium]|nr:Fur family transcriptional regulator [Negativicutes bacterium]
MTEEIIKRLREKGCKITPQRRAVIQSLLNFDKFPTASEVFNDIRPANPDVGLDTVYRNLNLLVDIGVVNQINLPGKDTKVFELALGGHHHHLICIGCGNANCLDYCPVDEKGLQQAAGSEFKIVGHSLELYGYCKKCRNRQPGGAQ